MTSFKPYENETDAFQIDTLNIENRLDRISIYGSLELTKDAQGLALAYRLKQIIERTIETLSNDKNLPDQIILAPTDEIENPF